MGLGDLLNKAQKLVEAKAEAVNTKTQTIVKRYDDFAQRYADDPLGTLENARHLASAKKRQRPSNKTKKIIQRDIIENHTQPKTDRSIEGISKQILAQRDSIVKNGFKQYEFIAGRDCCEKCAALNGKHFRVSAMKIGVNAPPMHEGCCCSIAAWEDDAEYEAWLDSIANGKKKRK